MWEAVEYDGGFCERRELKKKERKIFFFLSFFFLLLFEEGREEKVVSLFFERGRRGCRGRMRVLDGARTSKL